MLRKNLLLIAALVRLVMFPANSLTQTPTITSGPNIVRATEQNLVVRVTTDRAAVASFKYWPQTASEATAPTISKPANTTFDFDIPKDTVHNFRVQIAAEGQTASWSQTFSTEAWFAFQNQMTRFADFQPEQIAWNQVKLRMNAVGIPTLRITYKRSGEAGSGITQPYTLDAGANEKVVTLPDVEGARYTFDVVAIQADGRELRQPSFQITTGTRPSTPVIFTERQEERAVVESGTTLRVTYSLAPDQQIEYRFDLKDAATGFAKPIEGRCLSSNCVVTIPSVQRAGRYNYSMRVKPSGSSQELQLLEPEEVNLVEVPTYATITGPTLIFTKEGLKVQVGTSNLTDAALSFSSTAANGRTVRDSPRTTAHNFLISGQELKFLSEGAAQTATLSLLITEPGSPTGKVFEHTIKLGGEVSLPANGRRARDITQRIGEVLGAGVKAMLPIPLPN